MSASQGSKLRDRVMGAGAYVVDTCRAGEETRIARMSGQSVENLYTHGAALIGKSRKLMIFLEL